ncbi:hypothetical protein NDU88_004422 [Pleurodeles waltl]|uniref:Uncharacterized protein n=1 Tax=Pleurodeles waltl TaxID=8319 RepID=A0AAV7NL07_PLEWA|nr:hypothetical protein NDU88_004422 [Pleurodeles waltl]
MQTRHIMIEKPNPPKNPRPPLPARTLSAGIPAHPPPPPPSKPTSGPPTNDAQMTWVDSGGRTTIGGCDRHGRQVGPTATSAHIG